MIKKKAIRLSLVNPDFTTSARIEKTINQNLGGLYAQARDATTIDLIIPTNYQRKVVQLMSLIENFKVYRDSKAKVVINERTGTIVAGGDIQLLPVAITHGDLMIEVQSGKNKKADVKKESLYYINHRKTLNELVKGLNKFGVSSEDLISIFTALKKNGALVAEIELL